jgi:hypothetical protein
MQPLMTHSTLQSDEMVVQLSDLLRARYGADAAHVARRQLIGADTQDRAAWQAILDRLST